MPPALKRTLNWAAIAVGISVMGYFVSVAWGTSGRFSTIESTNTVQDSDIDCIELSQEQAGDEIQSLRTRIEVLEQWKIITDERFDNEIAAIRVDVRDIRNYLMGDRQ